MSLYFTARDQKVYHGDFLKAKDVPAGSVDLIVTSPPYNVGINYSGHEDNLPYDEFLKFSETWMAKCFKLGKDDCRFCLNVPFNTHKWGHRGTLADFTWLAQKVGWLYHSTVVWNKQAVPSRTAWGSWMSASAPHILQPAEAIVVLYKKNWAKDKSGESNITREEFIEWTIGIWNIGGEDPAVAGHPAPFPVELPRRCMRLLSYVGDTVLDPFVGSGTTLVACALDRRIGIGYDKDGKYCEVTKNRLVRDGMVLQEGLFDHLERGETCFLRTKPQGSFLEEPKFE
jgi:site-specific DNA-methyltransferase (adenine-specific)